MIDEHIEGIRLPPPFDFERVLEKHFIFHRRAYYNKQDVEGSGKARSDDIGD